MNTKYKMMSIYPFEYKQLEEYLNDMIKKGWRLTRINHPLNHSLTFQRCEPGSCYLYTDMNPSYSPMFPMDETPEEIAYRQFLEDYGLQFVSSNGPIQVFMSEQKITFPIREENEETTRILRQTARKTFITQVLCTLFVPLIYCNIIWNTLQYAMFTENREFFEIGAWFLLILCYISPIVPYVRWRFTGHVVTSMRCLQIRSYMTLALLVMSILLLGVIINAYSLMMVCALMLIICVVSKWFKTLYRATMPSMKKTILAVVSALVCLYICLSGMVYMGIYYLETEQPQAPFDVPIFTLTKGMDTGDGKKEQQESIAVKQYTYYDSDDYNEQDEVQDPFSWELYIVKPTILHDWIKTMYQKERRFNRLCYGYDGNVKQRDGIDVYKGKYSYLLVDDDHVLSISITAEELDRNWGSIRTLMDMK